MAFWRRKEEREKKKKKKRKEEDFESESMWDSEIIKKIKGAVM